jgi:integrase
LLLPHVIAQEVRAKKQITPEDARRMMGALAIEILLTSMVRLENLARIDRMKSLRTIGSGKHQRRQLVFPGQYVKNGKDLTFDLTPRTWRLWDYFVDECRPLLMTDASSQLFPLSGKNRNGQLRYLITKLVKQRTGLEVTPHQFRHVGVWLYLQAHPNDFERSRIMLGHKSDRTLKKYYA